MYAPYLYAIIVIVAAVVFRMAWLSNYSRRSRKNSLYNRYLPLAAPSLSAIGEDFETGSTGATFTLNKIDVNTPVDVTVSFPAQSLISQPPGWQAEQPQQAQRTTMGLPFGLGAVAFTTLLGIVGVILAGRSFRRETTISQNSPYQRLSAAAHGICRKMGASAPLLSLWAVPFLDAVDVSDAYVGDAAFGLRGQAAHPELIDHRSHPGQSAGCGHGSYFHPCDE
jgi:hypothetical protein